MGRDPKVASRGTGRLRVALSWKDEAGKRRYESCWELVDAFAGEVTLTSTSLEDGSKKARWEPTRQRERLQTGHWRPRAFARPCPRTHVTVIVVQLARGQRGRQPAKCAFYGDQTEKRQRCEERHVPKRMVQVGGRRLRAVQISVRCLEPCETSQDAETLTRIHQNATPRRAQAAIGACVGCKVTGAGVWITVWGRHRDPSLMRCKVEADRPESDQLQADAGNANRITTIARGEAKGEREAPR